jgi:hypothetical protein
LKLSEISSRPSSRDVRRPKPIHILDCEPPWRAGWRSARANLAPGLVLQAVALGLVVSYYQSAEVRAVIERLATWRADFGVVFAMVSTGVCGGLLPVLYLRWLPATRGRFSVMQSLAVTAFWTYKGFEVDLWYRVLAHLVGEGHDLRTVVMKTVLDQFVLCPLYFVPVAAIVYLWIETRFDGHAVAAELRAGGWYGRRVLPLLISNIGVWLPAATIIYSLPTPLQLQLQNLVLCFFTLLIAHQVRLGPLEFSTRRSDRART